MGTLPGLFCLSEVVSRSAGPPPPPLPPDMGGTGQLLLLLVADHGNQSETAMLCQLMHYVVNRTYRDKQTTVGREDEKR